MKLRFALAACTASLFVTFPLVAQSASGLEHGRGHGHGLYRTRLDGGPQCFTRREEMFLPDKFLQGPRAHARGERLRGLPGAEEAFFGWTKAGWGLSEFFGHRPFKMHKRGAWRPGCSPFAHVF